MPPLTFDLHKLGWKAFEDLVGCVLKATMGQTYQSFSEGADGGRDGAFYGSWKPQAGGEPYFGSFAVQCKHTGKASAALPKSVVDAELPKIQRLAHAGLADVYLFFTNYAIASGAAEKLQERFESAGAKKALVFGAEWVNKQIVENPSLRRLVPRIYGLGDLTQLITHQAYRQARSVLDSNVPDLACFVPTEAYRKCAHALKEHGFVMLIGEPASGKTMIANLMALSAADEWDLQTLILSCPEDLDSKWNPDEPKQFFWVDDAFGSNHYDFRRVQEWNQRLPKLKAAIHGGARIVFTSRSYIFRAAQHQLNTHKFELFNDNRVTIEVEKLSESERSMILYNHLKLGKQSKEFRRRVKKFLPMAAATPKFLPEIARRFSNPQLTSRLSLTQSGVEDFFTNPRPVMEDIVKGLANAERAALALVFANGGNLPIPLSGLDPSVINTVASMQSNIGDVKAALSSLDDSLLRKASGSDGQAWQFRHPTIRDAFASVVASNPELIDIYLSGVTKEMLVEEISCGEMNIEGVKLVVPQAMYGRVLGLIAPDGKEKALTRPLVAFLAARCSVEFLQQFFSEDGVAAMLVGLIQIANSYDSALIILSRLNNATSLSNEVRLAAVKRVASLSEVDYSDCFVDGDMVGKLITAEENAKLLAKQKDEIYSNVDEILDDIESNWQTDDDVDYAFHDILRLVERIHEENEFLYGEDGYDDSVAKKTEKFKDAIDGKIETMKKMQSDATSYDELETEETASSDAVSSRSIFDDIDE